MRISQNEESLFYSLLLKKSFSSQIDILNYSLQFVVDIHDCVLAALKIDLVLGIKEILEQNLLEQLEEQKLYDEFAKFVEYQDETVKSEIEIEIGYKKFFLFMCRFCYFNLRDMKKKKAELDFLDSIYEKLN